MNKIINYSLLSIALIGLFGCKTLPEGPRVTALPGSNKTVMSFEQDKLRCKDVALRQSGGKTANQVKDDTTGEHAMVGTLLGALLGAALGHNGAQSIAIGAATGMLLGAASGDEEGLFAGKDVQRNYDNAFVRCMYSAGHKVPVRVRYIEQQPAAKIVEPTVIITTPEPPVGTPYGVPPDFKP